MNSPGFLFVTKPPEFGEEFGYVLVFNIVDLSFIEAIEDKRFCSLAGGDRHSEKYIPDYDDIKTRVTITGGGGPQS